MSAEDNTPKSQRSAERMYQIRPSGLRKLFDLEHKLSKSMTQKILSFGLGNLNIPIMSEIIEPLKQALDDPISHRYSPNAGLLELREALADKYKTKYHLDYSPDQFIVTSGCLEALLNTFIALINPGEEVLIQDPTFGYYLNQIRLTGGKPVPIKLNEKFELEPESINESISSKTKALVLNYPSNPTGCVMNRNQVRALVEVASDNDIIVIADESYEEIIYDGIKHTCAAEFNDEKVIILSSFSKTYCMTGFRVGYAVGPPNLISPIYLVHQMNTACASTPSQIAARLALQSPQTIRDPMMKELKERRKETINAFTSVEGIELNYTPLGAFYIYPNVSGTGMNGAQFSEFLLKNCQIVVVPGDEFGAATPNHVRVSYGFLNQLGIKEAGLRMQNYFSKN